MATLQAFKRCVWDFFEVLSLSVFRFYVMYIFYGALLVGAFFISGPCVQANIAVTPVARDGEWWGEAHQEFVLRAQQGNVDVLFIGDSITRYWEDPKRGKQVWDREFAPLCAASFGIPGDRTQFVLWRLQNGEAEGIQPKVVVVLIGTNNTGAKYPAADVVAGINSVVAEIKTKFPKTKILLLGLLPRDKKESPKRIQVMEVNRLLASLWTESDPRVFYSDIGDRFLDGNGEIPMDVMPDLLHPNLKGYEIFAAAIKKPVLDMLNESK